MTDKTKDSTPETEETEDQNRKSRFWQGIDKTAGAFAAGCLAVIAVVAIWMFFQQSADIQTGQQAAAPGSTIVASADGANLPIQRATVMPQAEIRQLVTHKGSGPGCVAIIAVEPSAIAVTSSARGGPNVSLLLALNVEQAGWENSGGVFRTSVCIPAEQIKASQETGMSVCQLGARGSCRGFPSGNAMLTLKRFGVGVGFPVCWGPGDWCRRQVQQVRG